MLGLNGVVVLIWKTTKEYTSISRDLVECGSIRRAPECPRAFPLDSPFISSPVASGRSQTTSMVRRANFSMDPCQHVTQKCIKSINPKYAEWQVKEPSREDRVHEKSISCSENWGSGALPVILRWNFVWVTTWANPADVPSRNKPIESWYAIAPEAPVPSDRGLRVSSCPFGTGVAP